MNCILKKVIISLVVLLFLSLLLRYIFEELHYDIVGIVLAVIVGCIQLLLCCKAKRMIFRLFPVFFILLCFLMCLMLIFFAPGLGEIIAARIFAAMFSIAAIGIIAAWVIFFIYRLVILLFRSFKSSRIRYPYNG